MKKFRLVNVYLYLGEGSDSFIVDQYSIYPKHLIPKTRKHVQNAYVTFNQEQDDSIIFRDGLRGDKNNPRKRKLIDDILVIGSLINGCNWGLYSRIHDPDFPPVSNCNLENIELNDKSEIEDCFKKAMDCIKNSSWQKQYEDGFHLRMLINRANILNAESRFLSNMVIWEWLYPHIKNPNGATINDEKRGLQEILNFILNKFWENSVFHGNNIFQAIRNQLAHSGKIPINRVGCYVDPWMKELQWNSRDNNRGINDYLRFFDKLTQVVVLKTLNINAENIIKSELDRFLSQGKI